MKLYADNEVFPDKLHAGLLMTEIKMMWSSHQTDAQQSSGNLFQTVVHQAAGVLF